MVAAIGRATIGRAIEGAAAATAGLTA